MSCLTHLEFLEVETVDAEVRLVVERDDLPALEDEVDAAVEVADVVAVGPEDSTESHHITSRF